MGQRAGGLAEGNVTVHLDSAELKRRMAGAPLRTKQRAVSVLAINRYIDMLSRGQSAPNIKVADGIVVEGNHRYVAGYAIGKLPAIDPYIDVRPADPTFSFDAVFYDAADWGNR